MDEDIEKYVVFPPVFHVEEVHDPEGDHIEVVHVEGKDEKPVQANDFKVGDWVIIKENFDKIRFRGDPGIATQMLLKKGELSQIRGVRDTTCFLVGDGWTWAKRWLEPYNMKEVNINESDIMAVLE